MLNSSAPVDCAALAARLVQHPQLAQRFGEIMDLVDNAAGDIRNVKNNSLYGPNAVVYAIDPLVLERVARQKVRTPAPA